MIRIDGKLSQMEQTLVKMGNRVVSMHECVCEVLAEPNKERELEIIQADDRINHMEEEINDLAIESLALLAPVANDQDRYRAGAHR